MRPGNLSNTRTMKPRANRLGSLNSPMLGAFGKGIMSPAPGPPPTDQKILTSAIDISTGMPYVQDSRCSEGQKMVAWSEPCTGADCDPGEVETGEECDDDPNYQKKVATTTLIKPASPISVSAPVVKAAPKTTRSSTALPFTGSCPKSHYKSTDAAGDYCKPCAPGQLFHEGSCKAKPAPCPCNLKRQGDPDFGTCPPAPKGCGPPPQNQKCSVKGWGPANPICKCGQWRCPDIKDLMMARAAKAPAPAPKPATPAPAPKPATPAPLAGWGEAAVNVIPKVIVASLLLGPVFYILGRKYFK